MTGDTHQESDAPSPTGRELERRARADLIAFPRGAVRGVTDTVRRVSHTARNVAEVVRFGGLETDEEQSPFDVAAEQSTYRLRHYFPGASAAGTIPILLVPPLMMATEVWDVAPNSSAVGSLHAAGIDPWVVDFGDPGREPGGVERDLTDHVLAVSDAVDRVVAATGRPVVLAGYSQGGMFAYQAAAYRRNDGIDSLVTFGSPVDTTAPLPIPIAPDVAARLSAELVDSGLLRKITVPSWFVRLGFKMLDPARSVQDRIQFLLALGDRDALLPRERQRRFLDSEGWTAYSGPAIAELLEQFVTHNRMLEGGFVIDDRLVTLADIDLPVLTFVGQSDTLGHPDSVRAINRAAPRAEVWEVTLTGGHFGLVVGSKAVSTTWPAVAAWVAWRDGRIGRDELPADMRRAADVPERGHRAGAAATAAATAVAQGIELGFGVTRRVAGSARRVSRRARGLAREVPSQLPRLSRIEHLDPGSRISLGLLLDEQARRDPDGVAFLVGDRAYRQHDVKHRVDSVVRGLIALGVHHGDRVGVLMSTRPSAFTLVVALSRLGVTCVLLRPDGDVAREARLGDLAWMISDPELVDRRADLPDVRWAVLGGGAPGAAPRELPDGVVDMELIDPDEVTEPAWYRPNSHSAADVAFVLFTGEGAGTRALSITNRRWALSALGTASAAALRPGDTIYSVTPIYHSSALLTSIGGAVASGARFAMASADDPATFWAEVRRYGATHVSYTWTSLGPIVDAPPSRAELYHPIRMFFGSGMPRNLWRRVNARFPDVRVLEFYASAEGDAILANVAGRVPGSMGRPLPGTAAVRVAGFDLAGRELDRDAAGLAREARVDELGLLLTEVPAEVGAGGSTGASRDVLRSVFRSGDAWRSSGDLFLRDEYGDFWLAGPAAELVDTADGVAVPASARSALGALTGADTIVAYGIPDASDGHDQLVAAFTLRAGAEPVTSAQVTSVLGKLPESQRPAYVQCVASIPVTTWHRPQWRTLQARGVPTPARGRTVWQRAGNRYDVVDR